MSVLSSCLFVYPKRIAENMLVYIPAFIIDQTEAKKVIGGISKDAGLYKGYPNNSMASFCSAAVLVDLLRQLIPSRKTIIISNDLVF